MASIEMQLRKCFNLFIRGCFGCVFPHAKRSEIVITRLLGSCDSEVFAFKLCWFSVCYFSTVFRKIFY